MHDLDMGSKLVRFVKLDMRNDNLTTLEQKQTIGTILKPKRKGGLF